MGYLPPDTIISNLAQMVLDPEAHLFAIVCSGMHMAWVRVTSGRMKSDYRYSVYCSYNTFPFPSLSAEKKEDLAQHVFSVLDTREQFPELSMAELYDPEKMPTALRDAHHEMDLAVERCYRKKPFTNDEERLEYLFKLYEKMIEAEKQAAAKPKRKARKGK